MIASLRHAAISAIRRQIDNFFPPMAPQLSLVGYPSFDIRHDEDETSRGKKRLKTTLQKRIKMKDNIVIDKRTGELTLKHKLPYNWKNYLPGNAEYAPAPSVERT
jgi:ribosomal protein L32